MKRSELLIAVFLMIPIAWFVEELRAWWFIDVVGGQLFGAYPEWISAGHITRWAFEFAWSFVLGFAIASMAQSSSKITLAAICGAFAGLLYFALSSTFFSASAHWSMYFWAYGMYLVPALGAALGAALRVGIVATKEQRAV